MELHHEQRCEQRGHFFYCLERARQLCLANTLGQDCSAQTRIVCSGYPIVAARSACAPLAVEPAVQAQVIRLVRGASVHEVAAKLQHIARLELQSLLCDWLARPLGMVQQAN